MNIELNKNIPQLKEFLWVARARSKDTIRAILQKIHIEPDKKVANCSIIVATDGRRLHCAKLFEYPLPEGNYRIIKQTPSYIYLAEAGSDDIYPGFWSSIPSCNNAELKKVSVGVSEKNINLFSLAIDVYSLQKSIFHLRYLQEAMETPGEYFMLQRDIFSHLLIQNEPDNWKRLAVVMPLRPA